MQVIVIRPEPGNADSMTSLKAMGIEGFAMPLQEVVAVPWQVAATRFDGLLIGSANAVRCGGPGLETLKHVPVHGVGETTAAAARDAGFDVATTGSGGLQQVLDRLSDDGAKKLLRLAGEEQIALEVPRNISLETVVVYRLKEIGISEKKAARIPPDALVLAHSVGALRAFERECARHKMSNAAMQLACLGPRIADQAKADWHTIHIAAQPKEAALLALADQICQELG